MKELMEKLLAFPAVKAAMDFIDSDRARTLEEQLELVQIPSFSRQEQEIANVVAQKFRDLGYEVEMDSVNNVFATVPGGNGPAVLLTAHTDTVFPPGTDLTVRRDGEKYISPGINDDTRGMAEILSIARALKAHPIPMKGRLVLGANVGEEGLGDLYGVRQIFVHDKRPFDAFVSIDGGVGAITYGGVGSHRYHITYENLGGHSFMAFGMANPIHAMGRAIAAMDAEMQPPKEPKTTFNVGVVEGGTSVNSIANHCSMLVDMRSDSPVELEKIDKQFHEILQRTLKEHNERWNNREPVKIIIELVGDRPAGEQPIDMPMVQVFAAANEAMGIKTQYGAHGSTDSNIPISLGIPAVTVGWGGETGLYHSLEEYFIPKDEHQSVKKNLLGMLALVGVEGVSEPIAQIRK